MCKYISHVSDKIRIIRKQTNKQTKRSCGMNKNGDNFRKTSISNTYQEEMRDLHFGR